MRDAQTLAEIRARWRGREVRLMRRRLQSSGGTAVYAVGSEAAADRAHALLSEALDPHEMERVQISAPKRVRYLDCQRCGAPAHPIRGYCEEASAHDLAQAALFAKHCIACNVPGYHMRIENIE